MSTLDQYGRSRNATSHTYPDYGTIEVGPGYSQAANNRAPYYASQSIEILGKTVGFLIILPFTLICVAILAGIFSATSAAWIVTGHWFLLHLNTAPSPYSEASLWSTFLVGFWGSMATFLPFCVVDASIHACFWCAWGGAAMVWAFLNFVLVGCKVGLDCVAGVPLVGHYFGIETLGLEYVVLAAYTGETVMLFVMVGILCMSVAS
ncbi:uncharacterized protein BT62DRAFT_937383 [Guyanagaster necrorhizus]|uniref:Uncharacterized protein n=1 Tax=Guyanagaster necrorhizus TaxID=856835 RepID=A0A9P7VI56_9AGAR|nr:uncharacterized protein BT62DRAFT_937383 [Guyanagaster necrorhizus MCA 3950]KAG7441144.1 hypothetical protein BT62DRAFT_937383 [Guyanagaster necrorhizus MCA 3950]